MRHYASPYLPCMLLYCKRLPAGYGGVKLNDLQSSAQEGWCVYICDYRFDLSPYTDAFVMQTKGGTLQTLWYFTSHLSRAEKVRARLLSKRPATLEVTCFPLRTVYLHRDIFPKAFDLSQRQTRVSFFFSPSWNDFLEFWAKYHYSLAKKRCTEGYFYTSLYLMDPESMTRGAIVLAMRGGMFALQSGLSLHIYSRWLKAILLLNTDHVSRAASHYHLSVHLNLTSLKQPKLWQIWEQFCVEILCFQTCISFHSELAISFCFECI